MLLRKFFDKNGVIRCNLGAPKYIITNLKTTILRMINQDQNLNISEILTQIDLDVHV